GLREVPPELRQDGRVQHRASARLRRAFDPARRQWIVTDDRVIHLFDDREKSRDQKAEYFTSKTVLRQPSTVVVLAPGMAYAMLDRNGIWVYDVRTDAFQPQITFSHEQYG
ncbi:hypothetical protein AAVH_33591, partial [Aphelenchoides avenae]